MLERLLGLQSCVKTAEHHRNAAAAELVAELVGAQGRPDGGGHSDQFRAAIEVDVFKAFVAEGDVIFVGCEPAHQRDHQPHDETPSSLVRRAVEMHGCGLNQQNPGFLVHASSTAAWPVSRNGSLTGTTLRRRTVSQISTKA